MKKNIYFLFFILNFLYVYSLEYDENLKKAMELSKEKSYMGAEAEYMLLMTEYKTEELIIARANNIAWSGQIKRAIKFLEEQKETDNILMTKAKFLYWNEEKEKAYKIYKELQKKGIKIDKTGEEVINFFEEYNKYELKYSYYSDFEAKDRENFSSFYFTFDNYEKYQIVLSREYNYLESDLLFKQNFLEFYKDNYYILIGNSDYADYILGFDYTYKFLTLGIKNNKYSDDNVFFYKLRFDFYLKNFNIYQENIFVNSKYDSSPYYKTGINHQKFELDYYYDFKDLNTLEAKYKKEFKNFALNLGLYEKFNSSRTGYLIELIYRF